MFEHRPAIDAHAGNAADGEFHGEDLVLPAAGKVVRDFVDARDFAVRESGRVKVRRSCASLSYQRQMVFLAFVLLIKFPRP